MPWACRQPGGGSGNWGSARNATVAAKSQVMTRDHHETSMPATPVPTPGRPPTAAIVADQLPSALDGRQVPAPDVAALIRNPASSSPDAFINPDRPRT